MPSEPPFPAKSRHVAALRALAVTPGGLRSGSHPSVMPALKELGYVEERPMRTRPSETKWHLTKAGRDLLAAMGEGEARE